MYVLNITGKMDLFEKVGVSPSKNWCWRGRCCVLKVESWRWMHPLIGAKPCPGCNRGKWRFHLASLVTQKLKKMFLAVTICILAGGASQYMKTHVKCVCINIYMCIYGIHMACSPEFMMFSWRPEAGISDQDAWRGLKIRMFLRFLGSKRHPKSKVVCFQTF